MIESFSIPGGSIELLFYKSGVLILDTSSTPQLSMSISSTPPRQIARYLSIPASVKIYWLLYIRRLCDPILISIDLSLSILLCFSPKNTPISLQSWFSRILQGFSSFSLLDKLLILSHSCISCFET